MWWLAAFLVFLVIEIATVALSSIWFAAGALVTYVVSLFVDNVWIQLGVFLVVSLVLLVLTRPVTEKYLNRNREKTNADAIIGKTGIVTEEINNLKGAGRISISGQMWSGRSVLESDIIPEGTQVVIKEIQGVKALVERKDD